MAKRALLWGLALSMAGCTSVDSKLDERHNAVVPSAHLRICSRDEDCAAVDTDCDSCCPGGGAVNVKFLETFKSHQKSLCPRLREKPKADCTCVMARVRCLNKLCTWDYQGPDPNSL